MQFNTSNTPYRISPYKGLGKSVRKLLHVCCLYDTLVISCKATSVTVADNGVVNPRGPPTARPPEAWKFWNALEFLSGSESDDWDWNCGSYVRMPHNRLGRLSCQPRLLPRSCLQSSVLLRCVKREEGAIVLHPPRHTRYTPWQRSRELSAGALLSGYPSGPLPWGSNLDSKLLGNLIP